MKDLATIQQLSAAGRHQECLQACQNALQANPEETYAYKYAGKSLLALGQLEKAQQCLVKAHQLDGSDPETVKDIGNIFLYLGNQDTALEWYEKSLEINANYAPAFNNLGSLKRQLGNHKEAVDLFKRAIQADPKQIQAHVGAAASFLTLGDLDQAESFAAQALAINESATGINEILGIVFQNKSKPDQAIECYQKELEVNPQASNSHLNLGFLLLQKGQTAEAVESLVKASTLVPSEQCSLLLAQAYQNLGQFKEAIVEYKKLDIDQAKNKMIPFNLGLCLLNTGNNIDAIEVFKLAVQLDESFLPAWGNIGTALMNEGRHQEALPATQKVLALAPDNPTAHMNLGGIYKDLGQLDQALAATLKSLELKPDNPTAHMNLGGIYKDLGQLDQALAATLKSLELKPDNPTAHMNLGGIYEDLGQLDQALTSYRRGNVLKPSGIPLAAAANLFLSDLQKDNSEIDKERTAYVEGIKELAKNPTRFERYYKYIPTNMFWIAYHNREDDKDILESLERSLQPLQSQNNIEKIISKKEDLSIEGAISLGICSDFLKSHTIGKLYSELVKALKRKGFRLTIFRGPGAKTDALSQEIDEYTNASITLPVSLKEACSIVRKAELDILFYPDIGMSPYTYMLAMNRLAPVQVTSWGHPNTTGLQTMDYFLSSSLIEPQNAQTKYTERIIQLTKLPCIYPTLRIETEKASRSKFTLPLDPTLIGIPQSLFKFHPDYDEVLERIISRLPDAKYILIEGANKPITNRLKSRWAAKAPKTLANSIFLPRMNHQDYLCLLETVDILLDPFYFGSGNTFYEAMAIGTPLVTMPGAYMRGRIVAGGYKQMKLDNAPIANDIDDYIEITIRLAEDADLRRSLKQKIKTSALEHLFDDQEAANEIIEFIHAAVDENRKTGCLLPVEWSPSKSRSL